MRRFWVWAAVLAIGAVFLAGAGGAEPAKLRNVREALAYIEQNRPEELDLGVTNMGLADLWTIRQALPEGAALHFTMQLMYSNVSDTDREVNLYFLPNGVTAEDLEAVLTLFPEAEVVDVSKGIRIRNEVMIRVIEAHPEIRFIWMIQLNKGHSLCSADTAYSTFNDFYEPYRLTSEELEMLKYAPGLKALDLGHNSITSLDFLRFFPDLEFLILGENPKIADIEMIGTLKHLKYLEMFTVGVSDLSPLAGCTELVDLNLSNCKNVTDLSPLDGLASLERFWGTMMDGVPDEKKIAFIEQHPQTRSNFLAQNPTSDGWREHTRYQHYVWCLENHTWTSFDQEPYAFTAGQEPAVDSAYLENQKETLRFRIFVSGMLYGADSAGYAAEDADEYGENRDE